MRCHTMLCTEKQHAIQNVPKRRIFNFVVICFVSVFVRMWISLILKLIQATWYGFLFKLCDVLTAYSFSCEIFIPQSQLVCHFIIANHIFPNEKLKWVEATKLKFVSPFSKTWVPSFGEFPEQFYYSYLQLLHTCWNLLWDSTFSTTTTTTTTTKNYDWLTYFYRILPVISTIESDRYSVKNFSRPISHHKSIPFQSDEMFLLLQYPFALAVTEFRVLVICAYSPYKEQKIYRDKSTRKISSENLLFVKWNETFFPAINKKK